MSSWGPEAEGWDIAIEGHTQWTVIGIQVIQHTGDLDTGRIDSFSRLAAGDDGELSFENFFEVFGFGDLEHRVFAQVRILPQNFHIRFIGNKAQGNLASVLDPLRAEGESRLRCIDKGVGQA